MQFIRGVDQEPLYILHHPAICEDRVDVLGYFESAGYHLPVIIKRFTFAPGDPEGLERARHAARELLKALGVNED